MNLSYWEQKEWLENIDFAIVGSGIVGLSTALFLKQRFPESNITLLEKGILPQGASTKNAGFACFGSLSEILQDLKTHSENEVLELVQSRVQGLQLLRQSLGDASIDFRAYGGYELFLEKDTSVYENCLEKMSEINALLFSIFKADIYHLVADRFQFSKVKKKYIYNKFEGQLDTGKMMRALLKKVQNLGIQILNNVTVKSYEETNHSVQIKTDAFEFNAKKLILTTNGFTNTLLPTNTKPARAQVLITKPISNLQIKGTFHLDCGYYYFRNIDQRILLGGARNLDIVGETTTSFATTDKIQNELERLLSQVILPEKDFEIDQRWSGIMGVGSQKKPLVFQESDHVFAGVRMGGMGIAIGSSVGKQLSELIAQKKGGF